MRKSIHVAGFAVAMIGCALPAQAQSSNGPYVLARAGMSAPLGAMGVIASTEGKPTIGGLVGLGAGIRISRFEGSLQVSQTTGRTIRLRTCDSTDGCTTQEVRASLFAAGINVGVRPFGQGSPVLLSAGAMALHHWSRTACVGFCRALEEFGGVADQLAVTGGARVDLYRTGVRVFFTEVEVYSTRFKPSRTDPGDETRRYSELRLSVGLTAF